jgi:hypothetical protein
MIGWLSVNWSKPVALLVAGLFGWLFNETSNVIRLRREERRAIGRALSDLIIIRRHVLAAKKVAKTIRGLTKFSSQEHLYFQIAIDQLFPNDEGLQNRYEESIKVVMGIKPLLGFELAQQRTLIPMLGRLKQISAMSEEASEAWSGLAEHIEDTTNLDELINTLAWYHGWRTWLKVKQHLRTPLMDLPESLMDAMKGLSTNQKP